MCRFVAYLGAPILADGLVTKPENSLIHQSYHARELDMPVNGDGFGLGWYNQEIRPEPGIFKTISPAWNNENLKRNAGIIRSNCLFAHVRAASEGSVARQNCHPFRYKQYMMMHNGGIIGFQGIKRDLINQLSSHYYDWIAGQTDTEHIFALFMQNVANLAGREEGTALSLRFLAGCFKKTFGDIEAMKKARGLTGTAVYNLVITDGRRMIATRHSTQPDVETRKLYYTLGKEYVCRDNHCYMVNATGRPEAVLLVSEKLDREEEDWVPVPEHHVLLIEADLSLEVLSLEEVEVATLR